MTNSIEFTKMQGAGNDYIYIDTNRYDIPNPQELSIKLSDRHMGIGSDGLVLIGNSSIADFSMRIFNADGSEAAMCGNASRCIGKYVYEHGLTKKTHLTLETLSGIKQIYLSQNGESIDEVTVDMGTPSLIADCGIPMKEVEFQTELGTYIGTAISMGNTHLVIFVDDISKISLETIGPLLEHHSKFPDRTNVEFAQRISENTFRMRVWERGSGITMACGTGACATAAAAMLTGRIDNCCRIVMDGGTLRIEQQAETQHLLMTGPATEVFNGHLNI